VGHAGPAGTGPAGTGPAGTGPAGLAGPAVALAGAGRVNQKARTRSAIIEAARALADRGAELTMPAVARTALVSEATAYRYFPALMSLLSELDVGNWPEPAESLRPVAHTSDPVERVGYAAGVLLRGVRARQSVIRATIAGSITRPAVAAGRPGYRFGLIEEALAPYAASGRADPAVLEELRRGLAVVMSAEALFILTDLCGLSPDEAVASGVHLARTLTAAAVRPRA
jgi:AcrR family transcriptional regulator